MTGITHVNSLGMPGPPGPSGLAWTSACLVAWPVENTAKASFLGRYATVMDAEMLAIAVGWELGTTVLTDSQGAIGRIQNLQVELAKGWIEERVVTLQERAERKLGGSKGMAEFWVTNWQR